MEQQAAHPDLKWIKRIGKALNTLSIFAPGLAVRLFFRIVSTPRRQPIRDKDRKVMNSAEQSELQADGTKIHLYCWKSAENAPRVLFLHGWESNSGRWAHYIKAVHKAGYEVWAMDAPASGQSGGKRLNLLYFSRALTAFVRDKGAPYAIVGHSLGGGAAVLSTALLGAARPQKMVLLGVFAESSRVIRDFGKVLGVNEKILSGMERLIERKSGYTLQEYSVANQVRYLHDVRGLVMHDLNDEIAPVSEGKLIADNWNAQFIETVGLGHRMQDKSVVEMVVEFIKLSDE